MSNTLQLGTVCQLPKVVEIFLQHCSMGVSSLESKQANKPAILYWKNPPLFKDC